MQGLSTNSEDGSEVEAAEVEAEARSAASVPWNSEVPSEQRMPMMDMSSCKCVGWKRAVGMQQ